MESFSVPVRGGDLHCARWRGEGPLVLAVHGITANLMTWPPVRDRLQSPVDFVAVDLRGRGGSVALGGPFGLQTHCEDLLSVLDYLSEDQAVIAGHSLGAYIGIEFAAAHADRVRGLVLVDGGIALPLPRDVSVEQFISRILGPAVKRLEVRYRDVDSYRQSWRRHPAFQRADDWSRYVDAYAAYDLCGEAPALRSRCDPRVVIEDGSIPLSAAMRDRIDDVQAPMLLLRAERGLLDQAEPLLPSVSVAEKVAAIAHLEDRLIADTNHYTIVLGSGAARTAEAISEFVNAL